VRAIELNVTQVQIIPPRADVRREQWYSAIQPRELSGPAPPRERAKRGAVVARSVAALVAVRPTRSGAESRPDPRPIRRRPRIRRDSGQRERITEPAATLRAALLTPRSGA
jgi:hypothetical protein